MRPQGSRIAFLNQSRFSFNSFHRNKKKQWTLIDTKLKCWLFRCTHRNNQHFFFFQILNRIPHWSLVEKNHLYVSPASTSVTLCVQGTDVPRGSQSRWSPWRMCFTLPSTLFPASNDLFWQPRPVKHPLPWPAPPFPSRWSHWLFSHLWCLSLRLWCCPGCVLCLGKNKNQDEKSPPEAFSFLLHRRAFLKEAAGSDALLIAMTWLLDADSGRIVL